MYVQSVAGVNSYSPISVGDPRHVADLFHRLAQRTLDRRLAEVERAAGARPRPALVGERGALLQHQSRHGRAAFRIRIVVTNDEDHTRRSVDAPADVAIAAPHEPVARSSFHPPSVTRPPQVPQLVAGTDRHPIDLRA